jgi:hypothetical protein
MNKEREKAESDLRWYYQEASGDCGVRSQMGAISDILRSGVLPDGGRADNDGPPQRVLESWRRAREVYSVLSKLDLHKRRVLELQFSSTVMGKVSVALAAEQPAAIEGHANYIRARASSAVVPPKKTSCKPASNRKVKPQKYPISSLTVTGWVLWLATRKDQAAKDLFGMVVAEANHDLSTAMADYLRKSECHICHCVSHRMSCPKIKYGI